MTAAILIADDFPDDAHLLRRTVLSLRPKCPVLTVSGGKELKDYLDGKGRYADREAFSYPSLPCWI